MNFVFDITLFKNNYLIKYNYINSLKINFYNKIYMYSVISFIR